MITRIVKLQIQKEFIAEFQKTFSENHKNISSFPGCKEVKLVCDMNSPSTHFTISTWDSEQAIENYRNSELFKKIWSTVKPWFLEKAEAWSTTDF